MLKALALKLVMLMVISLAVFGGPTAGSPPAVRCIVLPLTGAEAAVVFGRGSFPGGAGQSGLHGTTRENLKGSERESPLRPQQEGFYPGSETLSKRATFKGTRRKRTPNPMVFVLQLGVVGVRDDIHSE